MFLGVQMLQEYGTWILAGTHSLVCSCMTPLLIIATMPMDFKCCWKTHLKTSLVSEPFPTLLPSSGMLYHKQPRKQTPWLSLAGATTSIIFVATSILLSWQKTCFVVTNAFVATKIILVAAPANDTWRSSANAWKCTCSVNDFAPCVFLFLFLKLLSITSIRCSKYPLLLLLVL